MSDDGTTARAFCPSESAAGAETDSFVRVLRDDVTSSFNQTADCCVVLKKV